MIWCAEDRTKAWQDFMHQGNLPTGGKATCENPVARNVKLGESLGINGTPALIFADGQIVSGAQPKEEIEKLLKITSEKSLAAIAKETEMLAGEGMSGNGNMIRGSDKVTKEEIEDFLKEISTYNAPKISK